MRVKGLEDGEVEGKVSWTDGLLVGIREGMFDFEGIKVLGVDE